MKKLTGTRPRPIVRTPEEQRKHRAEQAARAISRERSAMDPDRWHANWDRIERHLRDIQKRDEFMGLDIPAGGRRALLARARPDRARRRLRHVGPGRANGLGL